MNATEILVYGLREGATERWQEELLASSCRTPAHVDAVKAAASAAGFHSFRVAKFTPGEIPNFSAAINI